MNDFYTAADKELQNILPEIVKLRKDFHKHPETAWNESETKKRILTTLSNCNIKLHQPYIKTDIVFDMGEFSEKPLLLLRADMDALHQKETGKKVYKSINNGVAHNCGHDGHMCMLIGAVLIIDLLVKRGFALPRPIRIVFQPAEELECGGADLVSAGILNNVEKVLSIHGWPGLKKGDLFSKEGPFLAAAVSFSIIVTGKATHGGLPQNGISPFSTVAEVIPAIEEIKKQFLNQAIISMCNINGGSSDNIITGFIEIKGTIRYYDISVFNNVKIELKKVEDYLNKNSNCSLKTSFTSKYFKPVVNDNSFLQDLNKALKKESELYKKIPQAVEKTEAKTVSEDFAFYTDKKPGALILLGLGDKIPSLHASDFDFPDDVIEKGILLFLTAAYNL